MAHGPSLVSTSQEASRLALPAQPEVVERETHMGRIYQPTQRTDGRWQYSVALDGATHVVGYCAGWHYDDGAPEDERAATAWREARGAAQPFRLKYHTHGHGTPEDARRCFNEFLIDRHLRVDHAKTEEPCICCGVGTVRRVCLSALHAWPVCAKHDARAISIEQLTQAPAIRAEVVQVAAPPKVGAPPQEKTIEPGEKAPPRANAKESSDRDGLPGTLARRRPRG